MNRQALAFWTLALVVVTWLVWHWIEGDNGPLPSQETVVLPTPRTSPLQDEAWAPHFCSPAETRTILTKDEGRYWTDMSETDKARRQLCVTAKCLGNKPLVWQVHMMERIRRLWTGQLIPADPSAGRIKETWVPPHPGLLLTARSALAPQRWDLCHIKDDVEGGMPHTRAGADQDDEPAIMLPQGAQDWDDVRLTAVLVHEAMHVLQKLSPSTWHEFYVKEWDFRPAKDAEVPRDIQMRTRRNPDTFWPHRYWVWKDRWLLASVYVPASARRIQGGEGANLNPSAVGMALEAQLTDAEDILYDMRSGRSQAPGHVPEFVRFFGNRVHQCEHPNEISAVLMQQLLTDADLIEPLLEAIASIEPHDGATAIHLEFPHGRATPAMESLVPFLQRHFVSQTRPELLLAPLQLPSQRTGPMGQGTGPMGQGGHLPRTTAPAAVTHPRPPIRGAAPSPLAPRLPPLAAFALPLPLPAQAMS
jgi:hypothetical protein